MVAYHWQRLGILGALSPLSWEKVSGFGEAEAGKGVDTGHDAMIESAECHLRCHQCLLLT